MSRQRFTFIGIALASLLSVVGATSVSAQPACKSDLGGVDQSAGGANDQGDLTEFCLAPGNGSPYEFVASWSWDESSFGAQTGDACLLYDSNNNGFVDLATCVTVTDGGQMVGLPRLYTCNDTRPENCVSGTQINLCTGGHVAAQSCLTDADCTGGGTCPATYNTTCSVSVQPTDPFKTSPQQDDTVATCSVDFSDFGPAGNNATLLDACAYTSSSPTSNSRDCILFKECAANTDCDDGNTCTTDSCNLTTHTCRYDPSPNQGNACTDQLFCTTGTTCDASGFCGQGTATDCGDGNACTSDSCNETDHCVHDAAAADGATCGSSATSDCDKPDTCSNGACNANLVALGQPCGDSSSGDCDLADSCDGAGACQANHATDGTGCTADTNDCTDDVCAAGACTHPSKGAGASCGSAATSDCDGADSCDGSGVCQTNHHANGSGCTADTNQCTDDVCSGGTCTHPNKGAGASCGSTTTSDCDGADSCDGSGACLSNHHADGSSCTADTNECTDDVCAAGACTHPNKGAGASCGSPATSDCDAADSCDGAGVCQTNHHANGSGCTADTNECTDDVCAAGACTHPNKAAGATCGSAATSDCDDADACNGYGVCRTNHHANGSGCTADTNDCTSDVCSGGTCTHPNKQAGASCGSAAASDCDDADTCNASGVCQTNNHSDGSGCTADTNQCTNDICAAGACTHPNKAAGASCGSAATSVCDDADSCNASGVCLPNNHANGSSCTADSNECTSDVCSGGTCTHPNKTAGAPCGSSTTSDCDDADSCNGYGTCRTNNHANGSACTADTNDCTSDVCSGGTCTHPNKAAGAACGSSASSDCDGADTCNGSGACQTNVRANGVSCTSDGSDCTNDICSGGTCTHTNKALGTACGDSSQNVCTDPDTCNASGVCLPNNKTCSYVTDSSLCSFDYDSTLPGRQFNVLFTPDVQIWPGYKLNASNPGQYYYNAIVAGAPGASGSVRMVIPWPFITQGARPVHLYDADKIGINSQLCFRDGCSTPDGGEAFPATITIGDRSGGVHKGGVGSAGDAFGVFCPAASNALPNGLSGYNCEVSVSFHFPASGKTYVNIHLDYGVKGMKTDLNPADTAADRYDRGGTFPACGPNYYDALQNDGNSTPAGPLALGTCTTYEFSNTGSGTGGDSVQNVNTFKKISGVFGRCGRKSDGSSIAGMKVFLVKNDTHKTVGSAVTDGDGAYAIDYKHTGAPAYYTVTLGNGAKAPSRVIQLKANGWAEVDYDLTTNTWNTIFTGN